MKRLQFTFLGLLAIAMLTGGCGTARKEAHIHFVPKGGGPIAAIKPISVLLIVEDRRPPSDREFLSVVHVPGGSTLQYYTQEPVSLILQKALQSELERCGDKVVTEAGSGTQVQITLGVTRFAAWAERSGKEAQIDVEVTIGHEGKKLSSPQFTVSGNCRFKHGAILDVYSIAPDKEISQALAELIHNLTFDPRFVEGLQP